MKKKSFVISMLLLIITQNNTYAECTCDEYNDPKSPVNIVIKDLIRGDNSSAIELLEKTNNPDITNACGAGVLLISSIYNNEAITSLFLRSGANPNISNFEGLSPVENAAQWSSNEVLSMLIEAGANPNPQIHDCSKKSPFNTPIFLAAINNNIEGVKILLNSGADYSHKNINGITFFDILISKHSNETINDIIESIPESKLQLRENIANGIIFYSAASIGKEDKLEFLLSKSFSPNFNIDENAPYNTPLLIAAVAQNTKAIKILIEYGANINYTNNKGYNLKRLIKEKNIDDLNHLL